MRINIFAATVAFVAMSDISIEVEALHIQHDLHLGNAGQYLAQMEDMASMTSLAQKAGST